MSKARPVPDLANMIPSRLAPPPTPQVPRAVEERPATRRQANRTATIMIAGHFEADVSFALKGLCSTMSLKKGQRVTVQLALAEALGLLFDRYGVTPPEGLLQVDADAPAPRRARGEHASTRPES